MQSPAGLFALPNYTAGRCSTKRADVEPLVHARGNWVLDRFPEPA
jgi:hypothetical protein